MKYIIQVLMFWFSIITSYAQITYPYTFTSTGNPIINHIYTADPSPKVFSDGKLWLYASHDANNATDYSSMDGYHIFSTEDLKTWTDHGEVLHSRNVPWGIAEGGWMWAPDGVEKNGKYYLYFPHKQKTDNGGNNYWRIGVAIADKPQGPYIPEPNYIQGTGGTDPMCFIDDDGTAYLLFGKHQIAKLKPNMTELAETPRTINYGAANFHEGSYMHKRNGKYYFSYTNFEDPTNQGYYAIGDSPYGPFTYKGAVGPRPDGAQDHHSIVNFKDQWYYFYHIGGYNTDNRWNRRRVCIDYLCYNTDGTMNKVTHTKTGVGLAGIDRLCKESVMNQITRISLPGTIQAESYSSGEKIQVEQGATISNLGFIENGGFTEYQVTIASAGDHDFKFHHASNGSGGTIDILVDGVKKGSAVITSNGSWTSYTTTESKINLPLGIHTIRFNYIGMTGGFLFNLDKGEVSKSTTSVPAGTQNLVVYPAPAGNQFKSAIYEVRVTQNGVTKQSFVYQDANKHTAQKNSMTDWNHWTTFSFSGTVTIEVTKLSGNIGNTEIRPLSKKYSSQINGNKLTYNLSKPEKLWIKMDGMYEHPLFIFADAPEVNAPTASSSNVVYWGPGIHNVGKHYKLQSNKTYYLAGGAYVKGSFLSDNNASNVTIKGRGILSSEDIAHCGYNECRFDGVAIRFDGSSGKNNVVEGITLINPAQYCLQAYGGDLETYNVKFFGWHYETDGWVAGNGTKLYDSFFKVYDDVVKLYFDNLHVHDLVIYKQHNGAPFQLGWSNESGNDNLVENIDVIYDETNWNQTGLEGNRGFISHASGNTGSIVQRMTFHNINFDENISYLIGIRSQGTVKDFTLKNIHVKGTQTFKSYLNGGTMSGFSLENVTINGKCIQKDADFDLRKSGNIGAVTYKGCSTNPCTTDSDNDGTNDCNDLCPNDPNKTAPGNCGCGTAETSNCGVVTVTDITDLSVASFTCNEVVLNWGDVQNETGYRIRRKTASETVFTNITDVPANSTSYTDETVMENTAYTYMVRPLKDGVAVANSNQVNVTLSRCTITGMDSEEKEALTFYPNPVTDLLHLNSETQWTLLNASGQVLETGLGKVVNMKERNAGLYFIKVQTGVIKVIKE